MDVLMYIYWCITERNLYRFLSVHHNLWLCASILKTTDNTRSTVSQTHRNLYQSSQPTLGCFEIVSQSACGVPRNRRVFETPVRQHRTAVSLSLIITSGLRSRLYIFHVTCPTCIVHNIHSTSIDTNTTYCVLITCLESFSYWLYKVFMKIFLPTCCL